MSQPIGYADDWSEIATEIKQTAGYRCSSCGLRCLSSILHSQIKNKAEEIDPIDPGLKSARIESGDVGSDNGYFWNQTLGSST